MDFVADRGRPPAVMSTELGCEAGGEQSEVGLSTGWKPQERKGAAIPAIEYIVVYQELQRPTSLQLA